MIWTIPIYPLKNPQANRQFEIQKQNSLAQMSNSGYKGNGNMVIIDSQYGQLPAYLSRPADESEKTPSIVIVHEWLGLVPHIKNVADRYASRGYLALAPDLYHGKIASNPDEARKLTMSVTTEDSTKELTTAVNYLRAASRAKEGKIGITGFCFGGTHALNFVCESPEISAGAIYYASRLPSDEQLSRISAPLLIIYGDQDQSVKPEQARQLEATLRRLGKDAQLLMYEGAPHAFFNDEHKQTYRPEASKDAWEKTLLFLDANLRQA
jgi:carboxymethylenebutenolidase